MATSTIEGILTQVSEPTEYTDVKHISYPKSCTVTRVRVESDTVFRDLPLFSRLSSEYKGKKITIHEEYFTQSNKQYHTQQAYVDNQEVLHAVTIRTAYK